MKQKTYCSTITIYYTFYSVRTQCITDTSCTDSAQEFICGIYIYMCRKQHVKCRHATINNVFKYA